MCCTVLHLEHLRQAPIYGPEANRQSRGGVTKPQVLRQEQLLQSGPVDFSLSHKDAEGRGQIHSVRWGEHIVPAHWRRH